MKKRFTEEQIIGILQEMVSRHRQTWFQKLPMP